VKQLRHPATVIAAAALFFAFGGGALAYASGLIPGSRIKNHSIPAKKLTRSAIKSLHGLRGPAGAPGATGPKGATGSTGPQGPGGTIVTYDATASASPTVKPLGTFLGDTLSASCSIPSAGAAELTLYFKTASGAWRADDSELDRGSDGTVTPHVAKFDYPAGTFTTATLFTQAMAAAGGHEADVQDDLVQLGPSPGSMIWHAAASTGGGAQTCHFSVETIPETLTSISG
jgi:hypothetical protein